MIGLKHRFLKLNVSNVKVYHMDCRIFKEQILDGVGKKGDSSGAKALEGHLAVCNSCRVFDQAVQSGFERIASGRRSVNDPTLFQEIQDKMLKTKGVRFSDKKSVKMIRITAPLAMAAASVLLGIWLGGRIITHTAPPADETATANTSTELYAVEIHMNDEATAYMESYLSGN